MLLEGKLLSLVHFGSIQLTESEWAAIHPQLVQPFQDEGTANCVPEAILSCTLQARVDQPEFAEIDGNRHARGKYSRRTKIQYRKRTGFKDRILQRRLELCQFLNTDCQRNQTLHEERSHCVAF